MEVGRYSPVAIQAAVEEAVQQQQYGGQEVNAYGGAGLYANYAGLCRRVAQEKEQLMMTVVQGRRHHQMGRVGQNYGSNAGIEGNMRSWRYQTPSLPWWQRRQQQQAVYTDTENMPMHFSTAFTTTDGGRVGKDIGTGASTDPQAFTTVAGDDDESDEYSNWQQQQQQRNNYIEQAGQADADFGGQQQNHQMGMFLPQKMMANNNDNLVSNRAFAIPTSAEQQQQQDYEDQQQEKEQEMGQVSSNRVMMEMGRGGIGSSYYTSPGAGSRYRQTVGYGADAGGF